MQRTTATCSGPGMTVANGGTFLSDFKRRPWCVSCVCMCRVICHLTVRGILAFISIMRADLRRSVASHISREKACAGYPVPPLQLGLSLKGRHTHSYNDTSTHNTSKHTPPAHTKHHQHTLTLTPTLTHTPPAHTKHH